MRKAYRTLRRRPLFTPVWLTGLGIVAGLIVAVWLWGLAGTTTVIVVRHAEKLATADDNPALSPMGVARAQALAESLRDVPLAAIYVSEFRRTRETAAPVAAAGSAEVIEVNADEHAELVRRLRAHRGDTTLVVGHSNTIPDLVEHLGGEIAPIADDEYSRMLIVTTGRLSRTRVLTLRYGD